MRTLLCLIVRGYQIAISPVLHALAGPFAGCRFTPSCSQYYINAVRTHGAVRGSWMGFKRILRCNPWGGSGLDPVPGTEHLYADDDPDPGAIARAASAPAPGEEGSETKTCGCHHPGSAPTSR